LFAGRLKWAGLNCLAADLPSVIGRGKLEIPILRLARHSLLLAASR